VKKPLDKLIALEINYLLTVFILIMQSCKKINLIKLD
jgi:hypothetical protein